MNHKRLFKATRHPGIGIATKSFDYWTIDSSYPEWDSIHRVQGPFFNWMRELAPIHSKPPRLDIPSFNFFTFYSSCSDPYFCHHISIWKISASLLLVFFVQSFFSCNGIRWPLFSYLLQQFTVLINYLCALDTTFRILNTWYRLHVIWLYDFYGIFVLVGKAFTITHSYPLGHLS